MGVVALAQAVGTAGRGGVASVAALPKATLAKEPISFIPFSHVSYVERIPYSDHASQLLNLFLASYFFQVRVVLSPLREPR